MRTMCEGMLEDFKEWPGAINVHLQTMEQLRAQAEMSKEILCALERLSSQINDLDASLASLVPLRNIQRAAQACASNLTGPADSGRDTSHTNASNRSVHFQSTGVSCSADALSTSGSSHTASSGAGEVATFDVVKSQNSFLETLRTQLDKLVDSITLNLVNSEVELAPCLNDPTFETQNSIATNCSDQLADAQSPICASQANPQQDHIEQVKVHIGALSLSSSEPCCPRSLSLSPDQRSHACSSQPSSSPRAKTAR